MTINIYNLDKYEIFLVFIDLSFRVCLKIFRETEKSKYYNYLKSQKNMLKLSIKLIIQMLFIIELSFLFMMKLILLNLIFQKKIQKLQIE